MYPNYKEIHLLYVNNYRFDIYAFKNNHLIKLLFELNQKNKSTPRKNMNLKKLFVENFIYPEY